MNRRITTTILLGALVAACSKKTPETQPEPEMVSARINDKLEAPIARGDCKEATRRALANPNIDVEKVAVPLAMKPVPFDVRKGPKGVTDRNGWYLVHINVLVDAAGKPDMKTFVVDTASHPWLGTSLKASLAKWTFAPAELAGCKIPRTYSLGISPRDKKPAATKPAAAKPPAKKPPAAR
jgi:hypothetical protein